MFFNAIFLKDTGGIVENLLINTALRFLEPLRLPVTEFTVVMISSSGQHHTELEELYINTKISDLISLPAACKTLFFLDIDSLI